MCWSRRNSHKCGGVHTARANERSLGVAILVTDEQALETAPLLVLRVSTFRCTRGNTMLNREMLIVGAALLAVSGCASVAQTSRTGMIHDVSFEERMTPTTLRVQPG